MPSLRGVLPPLALDGEEQRDEGVLQLLLVLELVAHGEVGDELLGELPHEDLDVGQDLEEDRGIRVRPGLLGPNNVYLGLQRLKLY